MTTTRAVRRGRPQAPAAFGLPHDPLDNGVLHRRHRRTASGAGTPTGGEVKRIAPWRTPKGSVRAASSLGAEGR